MIFSCLFVFKVEILEIMEFTALPPPTVPMGKLKPPEGQGQRGGPYPGLRQTAQIPSHATPGRPRPGA